MVAWWDSFARWLYGRLGWIKYRDVIALSVWFLFALLNLAILTQPVIGRGGSQIEFDACLAWSVVGPDSEAAGSAEGLVLECSQRNDEGPDVAELAFQNSALQANLRLAHWAKWTGVFSGVGLLVLVFTLRGTLDATKVARDMAANQLRAYVVVPFVQLRALHVGVLEIDVGFANVGQTLAYRVAVQIEAFVTTQGDMGTPLYNRHRGELEEVGPLMPGTLGKPLKHGLDIDLTGLQLEHATAMRNWSSAGGGADSRPVIYFSLAVYFLDVMGRIHLEPFRFSLQSSIASSIGAHPVQFTGRPAIIDRWPT